MLEAKEEILKSRTDYEKEEKSAERSAAAGKPFAARRKKILDRKTGEPLRRRKNLWPRSIAAMREANRRRAKVSSSSQTGDA
ncbi:MAG: hypothetical protein ACLU38_10575 [Dysosmobacter sp.]